MGILHGLSLCGNVESPRHLQQAHAKRLGNLESTGLEPIFPFTPQLWQSMSTMGLGLDSIKLLVDGMVKASEGKTTAELSAKRDKMLTAMQIATRPHRS